MIICSDIIIYSDTAMQVMVELRVSWEENIKFGKYLHIVEEGKSRGWRAQCEQIEI